MEAFMLKEPSYKYAIPPPLGASKQIKLNTGTKELSKHFFTAFQLVNKAPLLMPCDFGMGVDQLFI